MENLYQNIAKSRSCEELLGEYKLKQKSEGELLCFELPNSNQVCLAREHSAESLTIYNPTRPFSRHGKRYLMGRVEALDSEDSKIMFFEKEGRVWKVVPGAPVFDLQDPFIVNNIQGYHIIGGVQIGYDFGCISYRTVFYRFRCCVRELIAEGALIEPFAIGPEGMKDIRLIELKNGKIGLFARPQGGRAGRGKIAYIEIDHLDQLEKSILKAKIIKNQFQPDEWGGVNELHLLKNGKVGVLGHIAHYDAFGIKNYYAMTFVFDPAKKIATPIEILTTADEFPAVESKNSTLGKIIFSGGLERKLGGAAYLYAGIGDTHAGRIEIADPFKDWEELGA